MAIRFHTNMCSGGRFYDVYFSGKGTNPAGYVNTYATGKSQISALTFDWVGEQIPICDGLLGWSYANSKANLVVMKDCYVNGEITKAGTYIMRNVSWENTTQYRFIVYR